MHLLSLLVACGGGESAEKSPAAAKPEPAEAAAPAPEAAEPAGPPARGDDTDRKSKNGKAELTLGDAKVSITYGRPEARGRTIWGELIPYGKVWRTGADEATVLTTTGPIKLGDAEIEAGSYALFTIPGEEEWTFLLNSQAKQWGNYDRDPKKDVATAMAKPEKTENTEVFTIAPADDKLYVSWAEVRVPIPLAVP